MLLYDIITLYNIKVNSFHLPLPKSEKYNHRNGLDCNIYLFTSFFNIVFKNTTKKKIYVSLPHICAYNII